MATRLSENMIAALRLTKMFSQGETSTYMPFASDNRTFEALEKRGLVIYKNDARIGKSYNGYALTDAGMAVITKTEQKD